MKINAYRITNFRSIKDTGWKKLSPDNVTVLVGQNESGKSSILRALSLSLNDHPFSEDDIRAGAPLPSVHVKVTASEEDMEVLFSETALKDLKEEITVRIAAALNSARKTCSSDIELICQVERDKDGDLVNDYTATADGLERGLQAALIFMDTEVGDVLGENKAPAVDTAAAVAQKVIDKAAHAEPILDQETLTAARNIVSLRVHMATPGAVLFEAADSHLPETVDIKDKAIPIGPGSAAARNYFTVAGVSLKDLATADRRTRESLQAQAGQRVSAELNRYWTQTIGTSGKRLQIKCALEYYGAEQDAAKAGQPYLSFWLIDGNNHLYPRQRSAGVSWYLSFFLQLLASEKRKNSRLILLDEPGANLHAKAQGDVLRLINQLAEQLTFLYTTHSPHLIEHSRLYRIHAVQRKDDAAGDSPTEVIESLQLAGASTDTLSPILTTMGLDLTHQNVIQKTNNVILEEPSAYYYFKAFWRLLKVEHEAHFISATGVNKVETLASLFRGWGLEYIVVLDDDNQGRKVCQELTKHFFGDVAEEARKQIIRIKDCHGIEDLFSTKCFRSLLLKDNDAQIMSKNTDYLRAASLSKPVLAYRFWLDVERGQITAEDMDAETMLRVKRVVAELASCLGEPPTRSDVEQQSVHRSLLA